MRRIACVAILATWISSALPAPAATPDPLRFVPDKADVMVKVEQPRKLVESYFALDVFKNLSKLEAFQELYDSTNIRRFNQLVSHFEKQLGARWPELLDRLAAGGVVAAGRIGDEKAPLLVVVQGSDEQLLKKFVEAALEVLLQELARRDVKAAVAKGTHRDIETGNLGDFHFAVVGSAFVISNRQEALHRAIDCQADGKGSLAGVATVAEAKKLLPPDPLAWLWMSFDNIKQFPQAKENLALPRNDVNLTVLFGGILDTVRRSPFLAAGLHSQDGGYLLTFRMNQGRETMPPELAIHIPPTEGEGSLPLLEPKSVLFSTSYYLDLAKFWEHRAKLFNEQQVKAFEDFDDRSGPFLLGNRFSKLVGQAGPHQRFVASYQAKTGYKNHPAQTIPAFAFVFDMRDEALGKTMEGIFRAAALLAGAQAKLKLTEEMHGDRTLVGYRFPEDEKFANDDANTRFNFSPCFVAVGNQFMMASTIELGHELIDLLEKEAKAKPKKSAHVVQTRFYAAGGAEFLQSIEDQVLAQTILDRALAPAEAKEEVKKLIALVRQIGALRIDESYTAKDFRYELRYVPKK